MRLVHALGAAVAATALVGSVAQATLTVSLVPQAISAAAVSADANLAGARTFDLMVNQTSEKWNVTDLKGVLGTGVGLAGGFYAPAGHTDIKYSPTAPSANLEYDTSVTTPRWEQTQNAAHIDVLGRADFPAPQAPPPAPGQPYITSGGIDIVWGDKLGNDAGATAADGSYRIARITMTGTTGAYLSGYNAGTAAVNTPQPFSNVYVPIQGDLNLDKLVNQNDLNIVLGNWQATAGVGYFTGDINMDGIVNQNDLNQILGAWQNSINAPAGAALGSVVPEPAALSLLAFAAPLAFRRRRS